MVRILLVSGYELGHQPLHLAVPSAALTQAGHDVRAHDLSLDPLDQAQIDWAEGVAFSVPMHTATRIAVETAARVVDRSLAFYGLYAGMARGRGTIIDGDYVPGLLEWAKGNEASNHRSMGKPQPLVPERSLLPPLNRYAHLDHQGVRVPIGYVEASVGCRHRCRHCPIPVVYDGRFRSIAPEQVLADVEQQVGMGARHLSFGDPDFLNGPAHALRVAAAIHKQHPDLTFDVTVKVEHILQQPDIWSRLVEYGLLFVVSAFESTNDMILAKLDKGHTHRDAYAAVELLSSQGVTVRPTWLPFTPWTSLNDMGDIVEFIGELGLESNVDPIQYTIRLLVPRGSLLEDEVGLGRYDSERLSYLWKSPDPRVDGLQRLLTKIVVGGVDAALPTSEVVSLVWEEIGRATERSFRLPGGTPAPRLTEPWFC